MKYLSVEGDRWGMAIRIMLRRLWRCGGDYPYRSSPETKDRKAGFPRHIKEPVDGRETP